LADPTGLQPDMAEPGAIVLFRHRQHRFAPPRDLAHVHPLLAFRSQLADGGRRTSASARQLELPVNVCRYSVLPILRALAGFVAGVGMRAAGAELTEREFNAWPVVVQQRNAAGAVESWTGAGPLLFRQPAADFEGNTASGFRPFWVQFNTPAGDFRSATFLYPLFSYSVDENTYKWSLFELVRQWDRRATAAAPKSPFEERTEFEVFPFWFSRQTGDPEMSYRGLFPI